MGTPYTLDSPFLNMAASGLDGIESERIASENRLRQLTRSATDADEEMRGFGLMPPSILEETHVGKCILTACKKMEGNGSDGTLLSPAHQFERLLEITGQQMRENPERPRRPQGFLPQIFTSSMICVGFQRQEKMAIRNLEQLVADHPLWPLMSPVKGLGKKQFARALAVIGDPYMKPEITVDDEEKGTIVQPSRPRTCEELKSLCGYGLVTVRFDDGEVSWFGGEPVRIAPRRQKGVRMNWNGTARQRIWLITNSGIKQLRKPCESGEGGYAIHPVDEEGFASCGCSPLRQVYDRARIKLESKTHCAPCPRCSPKGSKAEPGSPLNPAHQHLRAQREMAQWLLKRIYRYSMLLHEADALGIELSAPPLPRVPMSTVPRPAAVAAVPVS